MERGVTVGEDPAVGSDGPVATDRHGERSRRSGVPVSWANVGDVLLLTVAVTHPVDELNVWLENGSHADPVHHEIDWPPVPSAHTVMVTEEKSLPVASLTS